MWNLNNNINNLITKQIQTNRHKQQTYAHQGGMGSRMDWEIGTDIYTLLILCIKWITNENLLYSTGNSAQCFAVTYMGRKYIRDGIHVYV